MKINSFNGVAIAVLCFVAAWLFLAHATKGIPENPADLSDTRGLPAVAIYTVMLQALGLASIIFTALGSLVLLRLKSSSYGLRLCVYVLANVLFVFTSALGMLVICSYVLDTLSGIVGAAFYVLALALVLLAAPKKETVSE